jgi:hypothetical protein
MSDVTVPTIDTGPPAPGEQFDDEFDIDLKVLGVEITGWFDSPDPSEPGSTCHFSCQETCGGTCTCIGGCGG